MSMLIEKKLNNMTKDLSAHLQILLYNGFWPKVNLELICLMRRSHDFIHLPKLSSAHCRS